MCVCVGSEHSERFPGEKITTVCRSEDSEKDVLRENQKCVHFRTQCRSLWREHKLSVCVCISQHSEGFHGEKITSVCRSEDRERMCREKIRSVYVSEHSVVVCGEKMRVCVCLCFRTQ